MGIVKTLFFIAIFATLTLSIVLSYQSFTGYIVSDQSNNSSNILSFLFLLIGVFLTWLYISKLRNK